MNGIIKYAKEAKSLFSILIFGLMVLISAVLSIGIAYILMMFIDVATGDSERVISQVVWIAGGVLTASGLVAVIAAYLRATAIGRIEVSLRKKL